MGKQVRMLLPDADYTIQDCCQRRRRFRRWRFATGVGHTERLTVRHRLEVGLVAHPLVAWWSGRAANRKRCGDLPFV